MKEERKKDYSEFADKRIIYSAPTINDGNPIKVRVISAHYDVGITFVCDDPEHQPAPNHRSIDFEEEVFCLNKDFELNSPDGWGEEVYTKLFYELVEQIKTGKADYATTCAPEETPGPGSMIPCPFK